MEESSGAGQAQVLGNLTLVLRRQTWRAALRGARLLPNLGTISELRCHTLLPFHAHRVCHSTTHCTISYGQSVQYP